MEAVASTSPSCGLATFSGPDWTSNNTTSTSASPKYASPTTAQISGALCACTTSPPRRPRDLQGLVARGSRSPNLPLRRDFPPGRSAVIVECALCSGEFEARKGEILCPECRRDPPKIRLCKGCGGPSRSNRHWYCAGCAAKAAARQNGRRKQGTTVGRGYGAEHQAARKRWARLVARGEVMCRRCNRLIGSDQDWDLGHDDRDRSLPSAPEHLACNRATSGRRPGRPAVPVPVSPRRRQSEVW